MKKILLTFLFFIGLTTHVCPMIKLDEKTQKSIKKNIKWLAARSLCAQWKFITGCYDEKNCLKELKSIQTTRDSLSSNYPGLLEEFIITLADYDQQKQVTQKLREIVKSDFDFDKKMDCFYKISIEAERSSPFVKHFFTQAPDRITAFAIIINTDFSVKRMESAASLIEECALKLQGHLSPYHAIVLSTNLYQALAELSQDCEKCDFRTGLEKICMAFAKNEVNREQCLSCLFLKQTVTHYEKIVKKFIEK